MNDITILSSRRTSLFAVDDVRLTMLGTTAVRGSLTEAFSFQSIDFGDGTGQPPTTLPPGLIFQQGEFSLQSKQVVPIRVVSFQATQVLVDVAGDSDALDQVASAVAAVLERFKSPDGNPIVGEPTFEVDASEMSGRFGINLVNLLRPEVAAYLRHSHPDSKPDHEFVPYLWWNAGDSDVNYNGAIASTELGTFQLAFRAGRPIRDGVMFSAAPLRTEDHLAYLKELRTLSHTP